jgi:hypothetical protein
MYTQLGVMTKGTVIEVNVSELGMVTAGGKVVFGKYAQITNNPENDGCINAVLRESLIHTLRNGANERRQLFDFAVVFLHLLYLYFPCIIVIVSVLYQLGSFLCI